MTPERKKELRQDYPRPPENTRADTSVVRREVNEILDAMDALDAEVVDLREALTEIGVMRGPTTAGRARSVANKALAKHDR